MIDWLLDSDPAIRWQVLQDLTDAPAAEVAARGHASSTRAGAPASWPRRTPTGCGPAGRASRPRTRAASRASLGRRRCTRSRRCRSSVSTRRRRRPAGRSRSSPSTVAGSTPVSATSTARSSSASTDARSRPVPTSGWTSRRSSSGSSASASPTAAGTARRRTGRCARRSTRRSTSSTGCSSTSGRPAGPSPCREARRTAEEYLLERGLFRRKSTGEVVDPAYLDFAFPFYWHYDVLRALDYFRHAGVSPDPRMAEAVEVVRSKRQSDGRWLLDRVHPGRVYFDLEDGVGAPSRWNTLRALRVLDWWDRGPAASRA